jgi:hypothetical protein
MGKFISVWIFAVFLWTTVACTRKPSAAQLTVEIPAGFNGNFVLDMGVREAPPLPTDGGRYVLAVPSNGKMQTSTLLENPKVTFKNGSDGQIWGYSQRLFATGDGISVGGKIEFFVGTQKDFDAEQNKKNKSGDFFEVESIVAKV